MLVYSMVINVSVQYSRGLLLDFILFDPSDYISGNPFNTMKSFCSYSQCSYLNLLTFFSPEGGCSERRSDFSLKKDPPPA